MNKLDINSNNKNLKRMINKFYILDALKKAFFYIPILVIYFENVLDNSFQVAILLTIKTITVNIFEIPTGFIADRISRKTSILTGIILSICSLLIIIMLPKFIWLCIAQILFSIAETLNSGADIAFLYDNLKKFKKEEKFNNINRNLYFITSTSLFLSFIIGGFVYSKMIIGPFILSSIAFLFAFFICLSIKEETYKENNNFYNLKSKASNFKKISSQSNLLWYTLLLGNVISALFYSMYLYILPLLLINNNISQKHVGIIYACAIFTYGVGAKISKYINNDSNFLKFHSPLLAMILFIALGYTNNTIIFILLILLIRLLWGAYAVTFDNQINMLIKDSIIRASVISIGNSIKNGVASILILFYGISSNTLNISTVMVIIGALFLSFGPIAYKLTGYMQPANLKIKGEHHI